MIVADATALILLARIGRLELLKDVFGEVWIPEAVARELRKPGKAGVEALEQAMGGWIRVVPVRDRNLVAELPPRLGPGEREAIALALERGGKFLSDDKAARREARRRGLKVTGLLAVLLHAKARGVLPAVKPVLDELLEAGFRLAPELQMAVLREAGEEERRTGEQRYRRAG